jgi:phosphoenolpyruvate carboxylase
VAEHRRTMHWLLRCNHGLLDDNPTLARSIRHRFPYLDPLNHVGRLLRRYRAGQTDIRTSAAST